MRRVVAPPPTFYERYIKRYRQYYIAGGVLLLLLAVPVLALRGGSEPELSPGNMKIPSTAVFQKLKGVRSPLAVKAK